MDTTLLTGGLLAASFGAMLAVHLLEWRLYVVARNDRDVLRQQLAAMTADRDSWRSVGERALLVAELGRRVGTRATAVLTGKEGRT